METLRLGGGAKIAGDTFNFLASLINGNKQRQKLLSGILDSTFNFLASLINGN